MAPSVLIVDDDPLIRELLQSYLAQEGYQVRCASTAEQAEACLAESPVELVMLDIRLPGKDGLTLTRELRVRSEVGRSKSRSSTAWTSVPRAVAAVGGDGSLSMTRKR